MLQETVVREKCDAGLATDGDADRIGAVAEDGSICRLAQNLLRPAALAARTKKMARRRRARL